jgi:hypothetical protein
MHGHVRDELSRRWDSTDGRLDRDASASGIVANRGAIGASAIAVGREASGRIARDDAAAIRDSLQPAVHYLR